MKSIEEYAPLTEVDTINDENNSVCLYGDGVPKAHAFSIIIPTFKRGELMEKTLNSALAQTYEDYDIIIVDNDDDFNNTKVLELVKSKQSNKIYYYKNKKNIGAENNFNRGILLSKSERFVMLHDDDLLKNNCLEVVNKYCKGKRAVYNRYEVLDKNNPKPSIIPKRALIKRIYDKAFAILHAINPNKNTLNTQHIFEGLSPVGVIGVCYHRESAIAVGGFSRDYYPGSDFVFNINYIKNYGGYYTKQCLSSYCIGQNDTLTIGKVFAVFNYNVRGQMMNCCVKNNAHNQLTRTALYHYEVKDMRRMWNIDSDELNDNEIEKMNDDTVRAFLRRRAIKDKIHFGD